MFEMLSQNTYLWWIYCVNSRGVTSGYRWPNHRRWNLGAVRILPRRCSGSLEKEHIFKKIWIFLGRHVRVSLWNFHDCIGKALRDDRQSSFELLSQTPGRFVKVPSMLLLSVILARAKQSLSGPFGELRRSCPHEPLCQLLFSTSSPSESRAGQRMSPGLLIDNHLHNKAKRAVKQLRSDVIYALAWISC